MTIPAAASCQSIEILPMHEAESATPRAVVGHTDISARGYVRKTLGPEIMTFAAPWSLFQELEALVDGSFLGLESWRALVAEREP